MRDRGRSVGGFLLQRDRTLSERIQKETNKKANDVIQRWKAPKRPFSTIFLFYSFIFKIIKSFYHLLHNKNNLI